MPFYYRPQLRRMLTDFQNSFALRPMSHMRFCRAILLRNLIARQSCSIQLCMSHTKSLSHKQNQVRPSSGTDVYPHMPILRPHAARFHERRISSVTFTSAYLYGNVDIPVGVARTLADSSDFKLLGEWSSQQWEMPCLGRRWTAVQNLTPLAFYLGGEIRNRTNKHTNSKRYIHTLPIGMCG